MILFHMYHGLGSSCPMGKEKHASTHATQRESVICM